MATDSELFDGLVADPVERRAARQPATQVEERERERDIQDAVRIDDVRRALREMAGEGVVVGMRPIRADDIASLYAMELDVVAGAVQRRRAEFASGRRLLRDLLGSNRPILPGSTRAPVFPPGVVGSLAHDREVVVAAVSRSPRVRALGIDVEPADPLTPDVARLVLRHDEAGLDAHLAFTAKEAVYKAWSVLGGRILEHHEVALRSSGTSFEALVGDDQWRVRGRISTAGRRHVALVVVYDDDPCPVLHREGAVRL